MRTFFVSGSDTGVGKTRAVAALARLLGGAGGRGQIVKAVETGAAAGGGDAATARALAGTDATAHTLVAFAAPLAPLAAAAREGGTLSLSLLADRLAALPGCDWRIVEGAGGLAVPVDPDGRDWADFAAAIRADLVVLVVPDRLGAINQARLTLAYAVQRGLNAGLWLNAVTLPDAEVAAANREGLRSLGLPLWAEQPHGPLPAKIFPAFAALLAGGCPDEPAPDPLPEPLAARWAKALADRTAAGLRRTLRITDPAAGWLNLAYNDYLALAHDPAVLAAVVRAAPGVGTSASASPLVTGWQPVHAELTAALAAWHGFPSGLLWSSGFAANAAVLGTLPGRGDLVFADRLIHHSMIAGVLRSGARLVRYEHCNVAHLRRLLGETRGTGRAVFVATESVFSMDGDYPDLRALVELKREFGFFWILDEAHALGWYGPEGAGLARAAGVEADVDVLVGTLGKTLASGGAYSLFRDEAVRDHLINQAGEFIYSTGLSPLCAAAALAALARVRELSVEQPVWQARSRSLRVQLRQAGWNAPEGDSPIVPVRLDDPAAALALAATLREGGILAGAIRPPTVPAGTSRLRLSLSRTVGEAEQARLLTAMAAWRAGGAPLSDMGGMPMLRSTGILPVGLPDSGRPSRRDRP